MSLRSEPDLGERLRAADPLEDARPPTREELAAIRRDVLAEVRDPSPHDFLVPALVALAATLAIGLGFSRLGSAPGTTEETRTAETVRTVRTVRQERESREVQFKTSGGTLVVWTLDPEFDL